MALVLVGGMLGFGGAVAGYAALDLGLLASLSIWMGSGPAAGLLALALAARRPDDREVLATAA